MCSGSTAGQARAAAEPTGRVRERDQRPGEQLDRLQLVVGQRVQDDLPAGRGEREGALGGGDGLVIRASVVEMEGQKARDLSQPTPIVDGRREGLGLVQQRQHALEITGWKERRAQGEPEIKLKDFRLQTEEAMELDTNGKPLAVISQTTLSLDDVASTVDVLAGRFGSGFAA